MIKKNIQKNKGFVILFAVTLSSILLAIALGVINISIKEMRFSTSAKHTNDALFAADTGIEYVLFNDRSDSSRYIPVPGTEETWNTVIPNMGSEGVSCVKVLITKNNINTSVPVITHIVSKGYNIGDAICESTNSDRVEREIEVNY